MHSCGVIYDVQGSRSGIDVVPPPPENIAEGIPSAGGDRSYGVALDGDVIGAARAGPALRGAALRSPAAQRGQPPATARSWWSRCRPDGSITTVHDGVTGERLAGPLIGRELTSVSLDGMLVGAERRPRAVRPCGRFRAHRRAARPAARSAPCSSSDDGRALVAVVLRSDHLGVRHAEQVEAW